MAVPTSFEESNAALGKPPNMTDDQCGPLSVLQSEKDGYLINVSCWKLTQAELDEINKTGRVWLVVWGNVHPPVSIAGVKPIE